MILKELILREMHNNIISFRFYLICCLMIILSVFSSIMFAYDFQNRKSDYHRLVIQENNLWREQAKQLNNFGNGDKSVYKKPRSVEFFSSDNSSSLPNAFKLNIYSMLGIKKANRENYLLRSFERIDWTFIVGIIISFLALILTFDSISGDKESGTLRMQLSNAFPRSIFILSKYVSNMLILFIPFGLGFILSLLLITLLSGGSSFVLPFLYILKFLILSLIYVSIFILLGILISSLFGSSKTSLSLCLLVWIFWIILWPHIGLLIAGKIHPVSFIEYTERGNRLIDDITKNAPKEARDYNMSPDYKYMDLRVKWINDLENAENKIRNEYWQDHLYTVKIANRINRFSPASSFQYISESLFNTGLPGFENFYDAARQYRQILFEFVKSRDRLDKDSYHYLSIWHPDAYSNKPIPFEAIPVFSEASKSIGARFYNARYDIGYLFFLNVLLFVCAYVAFLKYDVR